jgi:hypothetical protein
MISILPKLLVSTIYLIAVNLIQPESYECSFTSIFWVILNLAKLIYAKCLQVDRVCEF